MAGKTLICGTGSRCEKHNRELHGYPCWACHEEWRESHPLTVAAMALMHDPKVSYAKALAAYKRASKAEREQLSRPGTPAGGDDR